MIQLDQLSRTYGSGTTKVNAFKNITIHIESGEFVVIQGPSGSGKTTLLLSIGAMLRPSSGRVIIDNKDIYAMPQRTQAMFRAQNIGFVFQMFYLIPYLNCIENIMLANGPSLSKNKRNDAIALLDTMQLAHRATHTPSKLSTGERQRVAIARAIINQPRLILADEPTGNLDPENAEHVIKHLADYHHNGGTVVVVSHGSIAEKYADRIFHLNKGCLVENE